MTNDVHQQIAYLRDRADTLRGMADEAEDPKIRSYYNQAYAAAKAAWMRLAGGVA